MVARRGGGDAVDGAEGALGRESEDVPGGESHEIGSVDGGCRNWEVGALYAGVWWFCVELSLVVEGWSLTSGDGFSGTELDRRHSLAGFVLFHSFL